MGAKHNNNDDNDDNTNNNTNDNDTNLLDETIDETDDNDDQASLGSQDNTTMNGLSMDASFKKRKDEWAERGAAKIIQESINPETGQKMRHVVKKGIKDFKFGEMLGDGAYSTVMLATSNDSGKKYAVKVLNKEYLIRQKKVKYVNIEKLALQRLNNSRSIIRLFFTFQDEASLYFLLEYAPNGDLLSLMKKFGSLNEECCCYYGAQIIDAIKFMHSKGIIHRDIKPENILLDKDMKVKITDFGTAKILDNKPPGTSYDLLTRSKSFVGTAEYVSPELLNDNYTDARSDIWAFGCIVFQMIAGKPPFKATNEYLTFQKVMKVQYAFTAGFPTVVRDLVKRILIKAPEQRLTIEAIEKHHFFRSKNFQDSSIWNDPAPEIQPYKINAKSMQAVPQLKDIPLPKRIVSSLPKKTIPRPSSATSPLVTRVNTDSSSHSLTPQLKKGPKKVPDERTREILENARKGINQRKKNLKQRAPSGAALAASAALTKNTSLFAHKKSPKSASTTKVNLTSSSGGKSSQNATIHQPRTPNPEQHTESVSSQHTDSINKSRESTPNLNGAKKSPQRTVSASASSPALPIITPPATPKPRADIYQQFLNKTDIQWSFYLESIDEHVMLTDEFTIAVMDNELFEKRLHKFHANLVLPQTLGIQKTTLLSQVVRGGATGFRNDDSINLTPESNFYEHHSFDPDLIADDYMIPTGDISALLTNNFNLAPVEEEQPPKGEQTNAPNMNNENSAFTGKFKKLFQHSRLGTQTETTPQDRCYKRLIILTSFGRCLIFVKRRTVNADTNLLYDLSCEIKLCEIGCEIKEVLPPPSTTSGATTTSNNLIVIHTPYRSFILGSENNDHSLWFNMFSQCIKLGFENKLKHKSKKSEPHFEPDLQNDQCKSSQSANILSPKPPRFLNPIVTKNDVFTDNSPSTPSSKSSPSTPELRKNSFSKTLKNNTNRTSRIFNAFVSSREKTGKKHGVTPVPSSGNLVNGLPNNAAKAIFGLGLSDSSNYSIEKTNTETSSSSKSNISRRTVSSSGSRLLNISEQEFRPNKH